MSHGECPFDKGDVLNPLNQMPPAEALQPIPDHDPDAALLGVEREDSSIPRTSTASKWSYPSERMFYNALRRKGHEPEAPDIPPMLAIHNFLNEAVWREICDWEALNDPECVLSLERFWGRFGDWTPRSWFFCKVRGAPEPFDRHDWMVRRCDGKAMRYIIDYYPSGEGHSVFNCDIRPALDSFEAINLRMKRAYLKLKNYLFEK